MTAGNAADAAADRSREVRLGLVMYGGVSLAIYIYGVAREFFDAVRGRGIFKLIKVLTDSDIVVDVISGTSAGGINGILLAYCMTNELEFGEAASTWREDGGIREMLRDPIHETMPKSVLQGNEYFLARLVETFGRLASCRLGDGVASTEEPSPIQELDLFVTSTDVHGRVDTQFDAAGHAIDVKDHRVVFQLKHRPHGRKEPLNPTWQDPQHPEWKITPELVFKALGKLARSTSSFPAAFEPVALGQPPWDGAPEDQLLSLWGWGPAGIDRNVFLMDGGVLDNKPFTLTLREIFYRLTERQVERKLFYVEPDPERFERLRRVSEPNLLKVVWGALSSIPGYESIVEDLRLLAEHNDRVRRFHRLVECHRSTEGAGIDASSKAFVERVRAWEDRRAAPPAITPDQVAPPTELPSQYAQSRLVALSERIVRGVIRVDGSDPHLSEAERHCASMLLQAYDRWPGNGDFTLYNFDVEFRMRRLFHALYACPDPRTGRGLDCGVIRRVRRALNRQTKLLEIIRNAIERALDEGNFGWKPDPADQALWESLPPEQAQQHWDARATSLWREQVAGVFLFLLNVGPGSDPLLPEGYESAWERDVAGDSWLDPGARALVHERFLERIARVKKHLANGTLQLIRPDPRHFDSVLLHTDACERQMLGKLGTVETHSVVDLKPTGTTLRDEYRAFIDIDAVLFPLESFADLHEQDIIETVRISPLDAQKGFSSRSLDEKVSGDAVSHFGGFFKQSWRSNDILWGRLDGVCQLTETLLTSARVAEVMSNDSLRVTVAARLRSDLQPKQLFPHAPAATLDSLESWLAEVADDSEDRRKSALQADRFATMIELLIEAQQLEILRDEVPNVIEDAIKEQAQWNEFRILTRKRDVAASRPEFDPAAAAFYQQGEGTLDPLVKTVAAEELARQAVQRIEDSPPPALEIRRPRDTSLGTFFRTKYKVGAESLLQDVPLVILLEILSTALLVTRNCLVAMLGPRAAAVRKNALYRVVSAGLWAFDGMVALLKSGARQVAGVMIGLAVLSAFALAVGVTWWREIIAPGGHVEMRWLCAFILLPVLVLAGECWLLGQVAWRRRGAAGSALHTRNPLARVPLKAAPLVVGILFTVALAAGIAARYVGPGQFGIQSALLHEPNQVFQMTQETRDQVRNSVLIDYAFLLAYSAALSLTALQVARLSVASGVLWALGPPMAWLALVGGAVDAVENSALLWLLLQGEPKPGSLSTLLQYVCAVGRLCSDAKFLLPTLVLAYCAVAGLQLVRRRRDVPA